MQYYNLNQNIRRAELERKEKKQKQSELTNIRSHNFTILSLHQQLPIRTLSRILSQTIHTLQGGAIVTVLCVSEPEGSNTGRVDVYHVFT